MPDASVDDEEPANRNWAGRTCLLGISGEELVLADEPETGVAHLVTALGIDLRAPRACVHTEYSRLLMQTMEWVWNLGTFVQFPRSWGMIKTADERRTKGRSLRSSLSAGKPCTWRRKAVDTDLQQEVDVYPAW